MEQEWTLLEAAQILRLTKNTVKGRLRKAPTGATRRSLDGRIILTEQGMEWLKGTEGNQQEPQQTGSEPRVNHEETTATDSEPTAPGFELVFESLQNQLKEKDQQIARLQDQAAALTAALQTAQEQTSTLTKALQSAQEQAQTAQALHAGTIQQNLLTATGTVDQAVAQQDLQEQAPAEPHRSRLWRWWHGQ